MIYFKLDNGLRKFSKIDVRLNSGIGENLFFIGDVIEGEVKFKPNNPLAIVAIGCKLIFEARGRVSTSSEVFWKETFLRSTIMEKDKEYKFPIKFINEKRESYKGINTNFGIKLQVYIHLVEEIKENKGFLQKLNSFIKANQVYHDSIYLKFKRKESGFRVIPEKGILVIKESFNWNFLLIILPILGIFYFLSYKIDGLYLGIASFVLVTFFIFLHLLLQDLIGGIELKYNTISPSQFSVKLINSKKWKFVKSMDVGYEIRESVIDRRGTSAVNLNSVIYNSNNLNINNPKGELELVNFFPKEAMGTIRIEDSRIYWTMVVRVVTKMGIPFNYESEFEVSRN